MNVVSRTMLALAAASMTILPVAAQAGTRAGDNGATYAVSAPGQGRDAEGEGLFGLGFGASFFVVIGLTGLLVLTVVVVNNNSRTPGAR
jgi:hypothetical protein